MSFKYRCSDYCYVGTRHVYLRVHWKSSAQKVTDPSTTPALDGFDLGFTSDPGEVHGLNLVPEYTHQTQDCWQVLRQQNESTCLETVISIRTPQVLKYRLNF